MSANKLNELKSNSSSTAADLKKLRTSSKPGVSNMASTKQSQELNLGSRYLKPEGASLKNFAYDINTKQREIKYLSDIRIPRDLNTQLGNKYLREAVSNGKSKLNAKVQKSRSPERSYILKSHRSKSSSIINSQANIRAYQENNDIDQLNTYTDIIYSQDKTEMDLPIRYSTHLDSKTGSSKILSHVLEKKYAVNSPSRKKQSEQESMLMQKEKYAKLSKNNSLTVSYQMSPDPFNYSKGNAQSNLSFNSNNRVGSSQVNCNNQSFYSIKDKLFFMDKSDAGLTLNMTAGNSNQFEKYADSLEHVINCINNEVDFGDSLSGEGSNFDLISVEEKADIILQLVIDKRRQLRLGAVVALYIIMKKYDINPKLRQKISESTIGLIHNYEIQEELFLIACFEILSLILNDKSYRSVYLENLSFFCMFLTDSNFPTLQKSSFNFIMRLGKPGLAMLIELSTKDYLEYQHFLLDSLLQTPFIQKNVISKALLNDLYSPDSSNRHSALASINRLYGVVDEEVTFKMSQFFKDPNSNKLEKIFLSCAIRSCGPFGEKLIIEELYRTKDYSTKVAIITALSNRLPKYPKYLKFNLTDNDCVELSKSLPGNFYTYSGDVLPTIYQGINERGNNMEGTENCDVLEVNIRDFLSSLLRFINSSPDYEKPQLVYHGSEFLLDQLNPLIKSKINNQANSSESSLQFFITSIIQQEDQEYLTEDGNFFITQESIKAISSCLNDYSVVARDSACSALGQIGLPEAYSTIDALTKKLDDEDPNVKSKASWALGRLASAVDEPTIIKLTEGLKSLMWRIKSSAMFSLSQIGERAASIALPHLFKLLREAPINKQMIAETIIKLGTNGETGLLKLVNTREEESNYKLRSSILQSFKLCNLNSPNIDFILETLYKCTSDLNSHTRKSALFSLKLLYDKNKDDQGKLYLRKKTIIPLYFQKLIDKDKDIQKVIFIFIRFHIYR